RRLPGQALPDRGTGAAPARADPPQHRPRASFDRMRRAGAGRQRQPFHPGRRTADADRAGAAHPRLPHASPGRGGQPRRARRARLRAGLRPRFQRPGRADRAHPPQGRRRPHRHRTRQGLPPGRAAVMAERRSLRLRLLLGGLLGVALAALVAALWLGQAFAEASERAFDRQLEAELQSLIASAEVDEDGRFELRSEPEDQHYAQPYSGHYWRVASGDLHFRSRSLWDGELVAPLPEQAGPARSLDLTGPRGEPLRARLQAVRFPRLAQPAVFLVAADRTELAADAARFRRLAAITVAIVAGGLLLVLVLMLMLGLRPLSRLADQVTR